MKSVLEDAALNGDEKASALSAQVQKAVREVVYLTEKPYALTMYVFIYGKQSDELAQLQQKISEINAKCILLRQRKNTGKRVCVQLESLVYVCM